MDSILETPYQPIAISDCIINKGETGLIMQCHDRVFGKVTILDEAGERLFTVESKGMASWSWRRTVKDAAGNHIFDLRKIIVYGVRNKWVVDSPSGREICSLRHISFIHRHAIDAVVLNEADKGNEVVVEVRPRDQGALTTMVYLNGCPLAEIQMTEVNYRHNGRDRSVWRARVAVGGGEDCGNYALSGRDATCFEGVDGTG